MAESLEHHQGVHTSCTWCSAAGLGISTIGDQGRSSPYRDRRTGITCSIAGDIHTQSGTEPIIDKGGKRTPEAALIQAYIERGTELAGAFDGDFSAVIHDPVAERLVLFNDHFGFRHTYLYEDDRILIFAPDLSAFQCYGGFTKRLDEQGLADYFNYFYHLGDRTMFEKVLLLPAATILTCDNHGTRRRTYWKPRYTGERGIDDLDEAVETGCRLFRESMQRRVSGGKRFIVPLSGGLDSRLILCVALELGCHVDAATFGGRRSRDYRVAREVCRVLGVASHTRVGIQRHWIPQFGEEQVRLGGGHYGTLASTRICGFARVMGTDYDGLLNGIFGGHISFGSPYFRDRDLADTALASGDVRDLVRSLEGHRYELVLADSADDRLNEIVREHRLKSIEEEWAKACSSSTSAAQRKDQFFLQNRIRRGMNYLDLNRHYYRSLLPFASFDLYRFYLSLSPDLVLRHRLYKEIFRRKFPRLARIAWSNTGVNLFREPSMRLKRHQQLKRKWIWYSNRLSLGLLDWPDQDLYMHYDRDFRRCALIRNWVEEILLGDRFLDRGHFSREGVLRLLHDERRGGAAFHEIGKLIVFELWARRFLDGDRTRTDTPPRRKIGLWSRLHGCRRLRPRCLNEVQTVPLTEPRCF